MARKCKVCGLSYDHRENGGLWPEEVKAFEDIRSGKVKTRRVTLEQILREIDSVG